MNCTDWEEQIVSETGSAELDEHIRGCEHCREFAAEIENNRKALAEVTIPATAFDAVRLRVRSEIQAKKRRNAWWAWSAVAAAAGVAILCVSLILPTTQPSVTPKLPHIAAHQPRIEQRPVTVPVVRRTHRVRHMPSGRLAVKTAPAQQSDPLVVKMLTDDPNVIIIWLVNEKGD